MQLKKMQTCMGEIRDTLAKTKTFMAYLVTRNDEFVEQLNDVMLHAELSYSEAVAEINKATGLTIAKQDVGQFDIKITNTTESKLIADIRACVFAGLEPVERVYIGDTTQSVVVGTEHVRYTQSFLERMWDLSNCMKLMNIMLLRASNGQFDVDGQ